MDAACKTDSTDQSSARRQARSAGGRGDLDDLDARLSDGRSRLAARAEGGDRPRTTNSATHATWVISAPSRCSRSLIGTAASSPKTARRPVFEPTTRRRINEGASGVARVSAASVWITLSTFAGAARPRRQRAGPDAGDHAGGTDPAKAVGMPIATTVPKTRRRRRIPSNRGNEVVRVRQQNGQVDRGLPDDNEYDLATSTELARQIARSGNDMAEVSRKPSGCEHDRASGPAGTCPRRVRATHRRFATLGASDRTTPAYRALSRRQRLGSAATGAPRESASSRR